MKTVEVTDAKASLEEYANSLRDEPILLTTGGRPIAMLLPIDQNDAETLVIGAHPRFRAMIEEARSQYAREGGISATEMRRRLGL